MKRLGNFKMKISFKLYLIVGLSVVAVILNNNIGFFAVSGGEEPTGHQLGPIEPLGPDAGSEFQGEGIVIQQ